MQETHILVTSSVGRTVADMVRVGQFGKDEAVRYCPCYFILQERDHPAMNLHLSSTYALQQGNLCSASDAESLVYMLYFSSGADIS